MAPLLPSTIPLLTFNEVLSRYPSIASPKLKNLDNIRYNAIPGILAQRKKDGDAHLEKSEVESLVEWKL